MFKYFDLFLGLGNGVIVSIWKWWNIKKKEALIGKGKERKKKEKEEWMMR